jgi:predicted proteasome-type protease
VVEGEIRYNTMKKRFDILVYDVKGEPRLIVECKAPTLTISQAVFDQVATYNVTLKVDYLMVTNGLEHYACHVNHLTGEVKFLEAMPGFELINR